MSTSSIVFEPAKSISNQSGQVPGVASVHPPPFPHDCPFRSPLIAPLASKPVEYVDDASAVAPFAASATFVRPVAPFTVTCTGADVVGAFRLSVATAVSVCGPVTLVTHVTAYGLVVSLPTRVPFS